MPHFRPPVQTETLPAGCYNGKKNGQSLPGKVKLALKLPWWSWISFWSWIWRYPFPVLRLGFGSCFEFIHLELMRRSVSYDSMILWSWCPGVSTVLCTGFSSRLCQVLMFWFKSSPGILENIPVAWGWVFSRHFLWVELVIQIIKRECHKLHCMETSSNRDLLDLHACLDVHYNLVGQISIFLFVGLGLCFWCFSCMEIRPVRSAHQMGHPGNVMEPLSDADDHWAEHE